MESGDCHIEQRLQRKDSVKSIDSKIQSDHQFNRRSTHFFDEMDDYSWICYGKLIYGLKCYAASMSIPVVILLNY